VFKRHIFWAWNLEPEDIEYTNKAVEEIKETTTDLIKKYKISQIPIVHNGYREVVTRISVAFATLLHSTNKDHTKVIVKKDHVKKAKDFIEEMLKKLELGKYKKKVEGELKLESGEYEKIIKSLNKTQIKILNVIELEAKSSKDIAIETSKSQQTVKQYYDELKKYDLIKTKRGKGVSITPKGIKILKKYRKSDVELGGFEELEREYKGRCSYCDEEKMLEWKDPKGNHMCQKCYRIETDQEIPTEEVG